MQQGYRSRGSGQPQKLRFPRFSRQHSFVHSEHQVCALGTDSFYFLYFLYFLLFLYSKSDVRHPAAAQQPPLARRTANPKRERPTQAHMGMDRLGIEPGPSRMLSGCDATTPTGPEPRPRVLKYLLGTAFRAEALSRPTRSASFLPFCCRRTPFGWCSLWANKCGLARSASFLPFCCRRTPFGWCSLWTNECGLDQRGKRSFCGWPLPLDR